MPSQTYYHLAQADYPDPFPAALDSAPVMLDKHTFFDGWVMNRMFSMIQAVQSILIANHSHWEV